MKEAFEIRRDDYSDDAELVQLVGTKLGDEEYAIDVLKIQEIIRTVEITIVPRMDNFILGVMNLRGKVIPVIDLRIRFSLERHDFDKATRIIVVRFEKQNIGFVVDEVTEVIRIKRSMVEPTPPLVGSIGQEYILGICKYDSRLIMLLDIDRVISESGEQIDSELRKKMFGPTIKPQAPQPLAPSSLTVAEAPLPDLMGDDDDLAAAKNNMVPNANAVPSPMIDHEEEHFMTMSKGSDDEAADSIDAQIAKELALREAETVDLNKKKRHSAPESTESVLTDALAQSAAIFSKDELHVEQGDLDALIARELAKREAETDELNKKHRQQSTIVDNVPLINGKPDSSAYVKIAEDKHVAVPVAEPSNVEPVKASVKADASSIQELKRIAGKIIAGESTEAINTNIKGEIGELLRLILDTKSKVDEIQPVLEGSKDTFPNVTSVLEDVNHTTEKATVNLKDASDSMSSFYSDFITDLATLKSLAKKETASEFMALHNKLCKNIAQAESLGFSILEALEFQDITEQKLRKVIKSIEDMGARIGTIVGFLQVQNNKPHDKRMDNLLLDYGLS